MAKSSTFEKRLSALEKTITDFFTGKPKKKTARRKSAKKTARKKTAKRKRA
ncbi:MAG: hypothetical protein RJB58_697 [Pseudomonadota bacterium]|jgi:hypothetical protein